VKNHKIANNSTITEAGEKWAQICNPSKLKENLLKVLLNLKPIKCCLIKIARFLEVTFQ